MGATGSVLNSGKKASAPNPHTPLSKKSNKSKNKKERRQQQQQQQQQQQCSRQGGEPVTAAFRRRASRDLNMSAPLSPPVRQPRTSDATNYSLLQMESPMIHEAVRASTAPPVLATPPMLATPPPPAGAAALAAGTSLTESNWNYWDIVAPTSPCELRRLPELEQNNFRRLVTSTHLKADAGVQKQTPSNPTGIMSANCTKPQLSSEGEGMLWLENNIPMVPQRQASVCFRASSRRMEYSFFGNIPDDEDDEGTEGDEDGAPAVHATISGRAASWLHSPPAAPIVAPPWETSPPMAALAAPSRSTARWEVDPCLATSTTTHGYTNAAREALADYEAEKEEREGKGSTLNPATAALGSVKSVARKDSFGFLMPSGKSVVIRSGGLSSFLHRGKGPHTTKGGAEAAKHHHSEGDFMDYFLTSQVTGEEVLEEAEQQDYHNTTAVYIEPYPGIDNPLECHVNAAPATSHFSPPLAVAAPPAVATSASKVSSPHKCPMPQPRMFGPRTAFTRSRPFDIERVLGFSVDRVRRVPSPDWQRVAEGWESLRHHQSPQSPWSNHRNVHLLPQHQQQLHSPRRNGYGATF